MDLLILKLERIDNTFYEKHNHQRLIWVLFLCLLLVWE